MRIFITKLSKSDSYDEWWKNYRIHEKRNEQISNLFYKFVDFYIKRHKKQITDWYVFTRIVYKCMDTLIEYRFINLSKNEKQILKYTLDTYCNAVYKRMNIPFSLDEKNIIELILIDARYAITDMLIPLTNV